LIPVHILIGEASKIRDQNATIDLFNFDERVAIEHDGYRLRVERDGDRVRLITRGGYDWSKNWAAKNPQNWGNPAEIGVIAAIREAWPCRK
jgi:ATP-dependent DNA ligase